MKKLINAATQVVPQMIAGIRYAHPELTALTPQALAAISPKRQVRLVAGGGSGHEPLDFGYLGTGLIDVAITGDVFTPPAADAIVTAVAALDRDHDYLFIVKNFEEDLASFASAQAILSARGYRCGQVVVSDDCSINPATQQPRRRGVAGTVLMMKLLGAAADAGGELAALVALGEQLNQHLFTLGVALSPAELPGQHQPTFTLATGEIAYGIGIHGEPGYQQEPMVSSELLARELVNKLTMVADYPRNQAVAVLVNGLGGLPPMDQFIFTNDIVQLLTVKGLDVQFVKTGEHLTTYNMRGVSVTLMGLVQPEWLPWLQKPVGGYGW